LSQLSPTDISRYSWQRSKQNQPGGLHAQPYSCPAGSDFASTDIHTNSAGTGFYNFAQHHHIQEPFSYSLLPDLDPFKATAFNESLRPDASSFGSSWFNDSDLKSSFDNSPSGNPWAYSGTDAEASLSDIFGAGQVRKSNACGGFSTFPDSFGLGSNLGSVESGKFGFPAAGGLSNRCRFLRVHQFRPKSFWAIFGRLDFICVSQICAYVH
jgi:hypothetical protein